MPCREHHTETLRLSGDQDPRAAGVVALRAADGGEHPLPGGRPVTLGVAPACDLVVDDPYVSAVHCVLEPSGPRLLVRDQGSKNGTLVDGNWIETAELSPGHELVVGRSRFVALGARAAGPDGAWSRLVGEDPALRRALDTARHAARTSQSVLILGETGTGKELVAHAVHEASRRCAGPFLALNCGGIPRELVASELFGHVRGAFTGADDDRTGMFAHASGGTLFLDEVGELPAEQQPHLLRALETRLIRPVGARLEHMVDVRLVAATNQLALGRRGSPLRADLYHRLAGFVIELPPLRQRPKDIPLLVESFLRELEPEFGAHAVGADTMRALMAAPWPGNVRQLRRAVERAVAVCDRDLDVDVLLPAAELAPPTSYAEGLASAVGSRARDGGGADPEALMRDVLLRAYQRHGSIRRAAAAVGMPKSTFADQAQRLGIVTGRRRA